MRQDDQRQAVKNIPLEQLKPFMSALTWSRRTWCGKPQHRRRTSRPQHLPRRKKVKRACLPPPRLSLLGRGRNLPADTDEQNQRIGGKHE